MCDVYAKLLVLEYYDSLPLSQVNFVEKTKRPGGILFFRTQSPRHFEGGDWNHGGTCQRLQPLVPREVSHFQSIPLFYPKFMNLLLRVVTDREER